MSATANWSYTAFATVWKVDGVDDWTQQATYAAPVTIKCGYGGEAETVTSATGAEYVSKTTYYTEYADAERGDLIALGSHSTLVPVPSAESIQSVIRFMDMDNKADDYQIVT